jgi:hypothetical protein
MAGRRRVFQAELIEIAAFSLFVCVMAGGASAGLSSAQIEFTPHVTPLEITQTPQATKVGTLVAPTAPPAGSPTQAPGSAWIVPGLTSKEAHARCSASWGDKTRACAWRPEVSRITFGLGQTRLFTPLSTPRLCGGDTPSKPSSKWLRSTMRFSMRNYSSKGNGAPLTFQRQASNQRADNFGYADRPTAD